MEKVLAANLAYINVITILANSLSHVLDSELQSAVIDWYARNSDFTVSKGAIRATRTKIVAKGANASHTMAFGFVDMVAIRSLTMKEFWAK